MKRVLIIEDEKSIAELQRDYLEIHGFAADLEHRGDTGLRRALSGDYDLVILDLMVPGMDGFELCRKLRAKTEIPIIVVSARSEETDIIRGLGLGADDYMTKPFSPAEMVARVKAHLDRYERLAGGGGTGRGVISIRGLTIDRASRRVHLDGREIRLTAKEFDLLAFLASHPDQVFSRSDLFERIWGLDAEGDLATVTVHIGRLRDKLEPDPANPRFIETVWGAGYRFRA
jgi:DNA-binding response OmpR family regulator